MGKFQREWIKSMPDREKKAALERKKKAEEWKAGEEERRARKEAERK